MRRPGISRAFCFEESFNAMRITDHLLALLVAFIWGTNFVAIELGLGELPPFLFAAMRFFLVAFPLVFFLRKPDCNWSALIAYGVLIGVGQFGLLFWAIRDNITPGLASLVVQVQVFFTILMSVVLFKESVRPVQWLAIAVSFCGLAVIAGFTDGQTTRLGLIVVVGAALGWAGGNLVVKHARPSNMISFIAWSSLFSFPPLVAMSIYFDGSDRVAEAFSMLSWVGWTVVLWQAIGNTLIGYGLWNLLLNRYPASTVTPWALMIPVFGLVSSALFLGEPLSWWKIAAAMLILSGLAMNIVSHRFSKSI